MLVINNDDFNNYLNLLFFQYILFYVLILCESKYFKEHLININICLKYFKQDHIDHHFVIIFISIHNFDYELPNLINCNQEYFDINLYDMYMIFDHIYDLKLIKEDYQHFHFSTINY